MSMNIKKDLPVSKKLFQAVYAGVVNPNDPPQKQLADQIKFDVE